MNGRRLPSGGLIDRTRPLEFHFDGQRLRGFAGDTLASAFLAAGIHIVGRSFKYHRPRGLWGSWADDPNAIFDVVQDAITRPNMHGATTMLEAGMHVRSVNAWPSARHDLKAVLDRFNRFLTAGFYYKTFMWPDWHLFEPAIRRMAGLGRVLPGDSTEGFALQTHDRCELLVVGGGAAGLAAARAAAEAGIDTVLVEDHPVAGGSLHGSAERVEGRSFSDWVDEQLSGIAAAGGRVMTATTATGVYDHGLVSLVTAAGFAARPRFCRMRAERMILATGAVDRPLVFEHNDRPGVMSPAAALDFLGRQAVLAGNRVALLTPGAERVAARLEAAGAEVSIFDHNAASIRARGGKRVEAIELDGERHGCDAILAASGQAPLVHLWCHAGGKLDWDATRAAFLPAEGPRAMTAVGALRGTDDLDAALEEAVLAARGAALPPRGTGQAGVLPRGGTGRRWVDFQNDVTTKDVALAARENYASVEHLKRYTTLGMATDQGRSSNVNGLALLAESLGRAVPEVGTTRFRPPYVPVAIDAYRGTRTGRLNRAPKRLALEGAHRMLDAALGEYGGWLRPAWYGRREFSGREDVAIRSEAIRARQTGGIADASPLGKIEVLGPDAEAFVDFVYYNTMRTLKPGDIRYGFMLTERGAVYDDGVLARLDENRFIVSCSSSHVDGVLASLEAWRQDGNDPDRVFIHDVTQNWVTVTVCGPLSREIVARLDLGLDLNPEAFQHMSIREASFDGSPARVARVSFTGDLSYEVSVPSSNASALWWRVLDAGAPLGAGPLGMEAQAILRAEKGYVIIGKDTDGETMPHDLGFGGPRDRKKTAYVGDRGLKMAAACDPDRPQLVGLEVPVGMPPLADGAHVYLTGTDGKKVSEGFVTSSYDSPTLGRPLALALLRRGQERAGEMVKLYHMGEEREARVVAPCVFDPDGQRLDA